MQRTLLPAMLAMALLLAPASAFAAEGDAEDLVVNIHSATDLAARIPDLAGAVTELVPAAQIHEEQPGILVVKATPALQRDLALLLAGLRRDLGPARERPDEAARVKRALDGARANVRTLGVLDTQSLALHVQEGSGQHVFEMLIGTTGLNAVLSPAAASRLADVEMSLDVLDASARQVLDMLLQQCELRLELDHGILRVQTVEESTVATILRDHRHVAVPTEDEREKATGGAPAAQPDPIDDLKSLVQALHEEVRALRKEVREVRSVLEAMRDR